MATVETVQGPVAVEGLGRTLMHEHIVILGPETLGNFNHVWGEPWWDEEKGVADAISKLRAVKETGIDTIVDPTAIGLGRDIRRIQRINAEVDLNILVCTGIYAFLELPNFFKYRTPEAIAEFFVRELDQGIDDTGVKPAFLKCAVEEYGIVGDLPVILAAVAIAAKETGAPVMVHTNAVAQTGLLALENLTSAGVDPEKIVIAHASDSNELDYIRRIADTGASIGYDRFNIPHFNPDENRIESALVLLEEGYGPQMHFGHDAAAFFDFMTGNPAFANERPDYLHLENVIFPAMRERGVTDAQIEQVMVESAGRFFS